MSSRRPSQNASSTPAAGWFSAPTASHWLLRHMLPATDLLPARTPLIHTLSVEQLKELATWVHVFLGMAALLSRYFYAAELQPPKNPPTRTRPSARTLTQYAAAFSSTFHRPRVRSFSIPV